MQKSGITIWHKLGVVGLFLALIAMAVGDEDRPGLLAMAKTTGEQRATAARDETGGENEQQWARSSWYQSSEPSDEKTAPKPREEAERSYDPDKNPFGDFRGSSSAPRGSSSDLRVGGITVGQTVRRGDPAPNSQGSYAAQAGQPAVELDDESEWETIY